MRAIVPSAFIISQRTAAGLRPARRARSIDASVWPARTSTPPASARSGNMWPGRARSAGRVRRSTSAATVAARSNAEMPVPPLAMSTETVKAVEWRAVLCATIMSRSSSWSRSALSGTQDQAAAVHRHHVDRGGGHELGGHDEVAFVLAVLVVDHDDELGRSGCLRSPARRQLAPWLTLLPFAGPGTGRFVPHRLGSSRSTYLATISTSRLTAPPACFEPSVVCSKVYGITATVNRESRTPVTVRLTPSTAMKPFSTM